MHHETRVGSGVLYRIGQNKPDECSFNQTKFQPITNSKIWREVIFTAWTLALPLCWKLPRIWKWRAPWTFWRKIGGGLKQCLNTSFHFLNAITSENISNDSSSEFVAVRLFPLPLHQPSTLSLKARHTTAFWWPLYSLLISPVSTHHRRARLSEEAVEGDKMVIWRYVNTEGIKYVIGSSLKS